MQVLCRSHTHTEEFGSLWESQYFSFLQVSGTMEEDGFLLKRVPIEESYINVACLSEVFLFHDWIILHC